MSQSPGYIILHFSRKTPREIAEHIVETMHKEQCYPVREHIHWIGGTLTEHKVFGSGVAILERRS
jgi:predicted nucleotide-binding protein (sugar kinase/HSP70/actin superfamily)